MRRWSKRSAWTERMFDPEARRQIQILRLICKALEASLREFGECRALPSNRGNTKIQFVK